MTTTSSTIDEAAKRQTLGSLIDSRVRSTPGATAILAPAREPLSYGALGRQIASAAHTLAAGGWGSGSRIGLALPNGPETAVALVAVVSCATCVPLNPNSDEETLRYLLKRLRVDAIVVPESGFPIVREVATDLALPIVTLVVSRHDPAGTFALRCETRRAPVTAGAPGGDDIALVLHTSGTTGRSKVVPLTQRSQLDSTLERIRLFQLTARDRSLCITPMFTATAIRSSLFPPLAAGGSVVCPLEFEAGQMLGWLSALEPTFYGAAPAVHRALLEAIVARGAPPRHALRFIVSGSTVLPEELQAGLEDALGVPIIQTYAMTESGTITQNLLPPGTRRPGSVGVATLGEVGILGDDGQFLPAGELGEVVVRGPQVFTGYEDDPEANRRAFFGDWFRTGDLGYLEADGFLHVTGRLKEIINRGGFKVPPAEVDAVLMRHPAVAEAATFGIAHATLGEDVMAAVVLREGSAATLQQLRDFAFGALADFKVPSRIVPVSNIPKTSLGKVRRRELADILKQDLQPAYNKPRNAREAIVAEVFGEVLGIAAVGCFDNFFALGGDSLRSAQVTTRVNAMFDCQLDSSSLFRRPTVAEFAAEIAKRVQGSDAVAAAPIVRLPRSEGVPR